MVSTEKEDTHAGRSIPGRHCHPERSEGSVSLSTPPDNPTVPPWSGKVSPTKEQRQDKWREGQSCRMETALDEDDVSLNKAKVIWQKIIKFVNLSTYYSWRSYLRVNSLMDTIGHSLTQRVSPILLSLPALYPILMEGRF